ncbi:MULTISPECIES: phage holin, lambda family [unclassified Brenneria]|uniref:phage holin, lambda family n=1 Tax=unclassified Brenneria TaxID=2634434 RepID=UPI0015529980|nr:MULTISPECIES: phage holin, lambda family [unclassified Brenneria]MBJ7222331.1 phage holin, lambda family [Brenneria sp. L3-3C-1]MEE3643574.1 phage holin, lambda family [Brenneria sp. L3_3C_1]MEE3651284.1 phage holin, lambda family [Brenneria sp. HEZEL_4_2_4]NPD01239.1 phage holin, lambda family [Brenneria sp. hezel4-2-4]
MQSNVFSWAGIYELIHAWWRGDVPTGGVLLSIFIAILRVAYTGGGWQRMLLEGALCGALTLTAVASLEYYSLPKTLTPALGGMIGFIGVEQIRRGILRLFNERTENEKNTKK